MKYISVVLGYTDYTGLCRNSELSEVKGTPTTSKLRVTLIIEFKNVLNWNNFSKSIKSRKWNAEAGFYYIQCFFFVEYISNQVTVIHIKMSTLNNRLEAFMMTGACAANDLLPRLSQYVYITYCFVYVLEISRDSTVSKKRL